MKPSLDQDTIRRLTSGVPVREWPPEWIAGYRPGFKVEFIEMARPKADQKEED